MLKEKFDYDFMVIKMAAVHHLGFVKFEFFNGRGG